MVLKIVRQGPHLVARDTDTGRIATRTNRQGEVEQIRATVPVRASRQTWRKGLARITNNGTMLDEILLGLALGAAYEPVLPDGRKGEPVVPSPEVRRAAAVDLMHMLRGKPVAQTEVMKAEKEAEDLEQYRALSDADLERVIQGEYKLLSNDPDSEDSDSE